MKNKFNLLFLILLTSCSQKTKKSPECTELNAICEIQKEWCLVKPLSLIDTNSVDVLGRKLVIGKWYLRNYRTRVLLPFIDEPETYGRLDNHNLEIFELEYPNVSDNECLILRSAKIDTLSMFTDHHMGDRTYVIDAGILCTKDGEVKISTNVHANGYSVGWIDYK